jgi:hypothetical protein
MAGNHEVRPDPQRDSRIVCLSSGATVRRSITSALIPRCASASAAATASCTIRETLTSLVDRLEAQGLIKRTPHPTDRRSTVAQITPTGRSLVQKAIKRLNSELFRDLGLTSDEVQALIALLTKLRRSCGDFDRCLDGRSGD